MKVLFCAHKRDRESSHSLFVITNYLFLFPFNSCRGFGGNIVDDAINVFHFVDDSDAHFIQHVVGDARPIGGHKVGGGDGAKGQCVIVGSEVAHNADASIIG